MAPNNRKPIPKVAYAPMLGMETYVRARVDKDYSHLVQLRASAINQCTYCLAMHRRDARKDGWTEEKIGRVENWTETPDVFSDEEHAALELTDAVTKIRGEESVPDELWNRVERLHGEKGARNLLMAIVTINAWNRIGITTRLDPNSLSGVTPFDLGQN
ncbi:4-carboxymuconolactone decarboxylase [Corynebacterium sp. HMSC05H05]|uniref:carboxymuconolactone decarboxylase family protein n=1 Tax=unclassified Corynebacterium TaxID=2624378 RepID=UPI0008A5D630|nr:MULTISPECIES: carboxymuconolactone decarboxylase family protein [unclassified Corynebacterium]MDK8880245.1 carboxymuconolactone decarboxylase family protein [Corynebacterium sp. MSK008]OFT59144.1 4-carboxymuconolactone decarboxylase [Corynebacterium sp. HMSC05H05]OHR20275.1 4-carboxymuconolactone decarboxylase [Corynebacterium sp. HMSC034A01]